MPAAFVALLSLVTAGGGLAVRSDSACPGADEVRARLVPLLSRAPDASVQVTTQPGQLSVQVETGDLRSVRTIAADASCDDRAGAAAVVAAGLLAEVPSLTLPAPELPSALDGVEPVAAAPRPVAIELGAGVVGTSVASAAAFGGRAEVAVGRPGGRLSLWLDLAATGSRQAPLHGHLVRWSRPSAGAGMRVHARARPSLSFDLGILGSAVIAAGEGFEVDSTDVGLAAGAVAGSRLGWAVGRTTLWLDLRALAWPGPHTLGVALPAGMRATAALPRLEGHLSLGLSVRAP